MFDSKKTSLFKVATSTSPFIQAGLKESAKTLTGNGGLAYSTTGNPFIDQFGGTSKYRELRSFEDIQNDCEKLWAVDHKLTVKFIFFIRMVCRKINGEDFTTSAQKGSEMKHEGIMRLIWLHTKDPVTFWKNAWLIPLVGSWKDIFVMLRYDLIYNGWEGRVLDWDKFGDLILSGLNSASQVNLVKKYLPQVKAKSKCKTVEAQANCLIAKWICSKIFGSSALRTDAEKYQVYRKYARLKTSGTAHTWQQLISKQEYSFIDFDKIHGRALSLLVKSKFLDNHGLREKYSKWIGSPETKEVKYTGFVHELFEPMKSYRSLVQVPQHIKDTINKQFMTLVNKCLEEGNETNLIVVRDTSASMGSQATGTKMSCYSVSKAIALYFSYFLKGYFQKAWIEFNSDAQMHLWQGDTPLEQWFNDHSDYVGSTNFESVLRLLAKIKEQGVPEEEFPHGILCISDAEFNPSSLNATSVEGARDILRSAGFSKSYVQDFVICLWNLTNSYYDRKSGPVFQTFGNVKNVFYMSGYSAQIVSFLSGKIQTTQDLFDAAMDQEILNMITL